ncbi:Piwi/Argonaute/Zwille siRNA-binding domain protein [Wolbachia endosymbiont of Cylisticus convexus]|nr:Piwi/Argonaute/Zwille siRNA-binding domain protein [Wolbachia endosymbiont of Cylisticus convexus]
MGLNSEEKVKAILGVAKENNMLKEVLNTQNIIKLPNGEERTLTPLGFAISFNNSEERIKDILGVAEKDKEVLKEVFASVKEHERKRLTEILETLKNQEQDEEQKTKIDSWLEILAKSVSNSHKKDTVKAINKSIMIGSVCGVIAALAVGIGCSIDGVALPILALIGIAVAAALVIGVIAGGITYSVSKPSDKLDKPDLKVFNQQVPEKA